MKTVLIVDDHPVMRLVLRTQLASVLGIGTILEAGNGPAAVELTKTAAPDLVVLDLDLPGTGGMELIPRLKSIHPTIRILVFSGQNPAVYGPRVMALAADGYVSKTEDISEILRAVEMVLAGYRVFPEAVTSSASNVDGKGDEARLRELSNKEILVLGLLVKGHSNQAIAEMLHISNKTVSSHKINLMKKLRTSSVVELADLAKRFHIAP
ncbi:response regulator transcription factor [Pandoraea pnomenusa]|uniref:response regulator transcription factor n=1 Tax=Pandoraea pnomenusa TaxID=93220 RepID=UPI0033413D94